VCSFAAHRRCPGKIIFPDGAAARRDNRGMQPPTREDDAGVPIAAVEQATGIARATLRIWERRYGFPQPGRDPRVERSYPTEQVEKLRLIAGLVNQGHRPSRLVQLPLAELERLAGPASAPSARAGADHGTAAQAGEDPALALLRGHDTGALTLHLEESLRSQGLDGFVTRRMPALNLQVGAGWARGELEVYQEHLYSEAVQVVLRSAMLRLPAPSREARPRVLLATLPEEWHGIGLLMAQVLLLAQGCRCTSLGVRVPLPQLVLAAAAFGSDIVGLSFSPSMNPAHVLRGLEQLRGELSPQVVIWAGGSCPVLSRRRVAGVRPVRDIADLPVAVAQWRMQQG
jgi:methanogenic corrinoid protein MtbC1